MKLHRYFATVACVAGFVGTAAAQPGDETPAPSPADRLASQQGVLADKYSKLEKLLDEMARIEAISNPRRASLLMQALKQSKAQLTTVKLNASVRLLNQQQLKQALDRQREAHTDMQALLQLLLSESRSDRLKREQDRIREYIQEVERILRLQKSVQGRTEGGSEPQELAEDQGNIANRTGELAKQIQESEEGGNSRQPQGESTDDQPSEQQPGQGEQQDADDDKPEQEPRDDEQQESDAESSQVKGKQSSSDKQQPGQQSQQGKPSDGQSKQPPSDQSQQQPSQDQSQQPQQSQPGQSGEPPEQQPQDDANPARKRLQAAEQKMREAQQKLEEAKRSEAVEDQEKAKEELERAKAELERILRQLREEEVERMLALLEGRFRKMLQQQLRVYEDTKSLDASQDELRKQKNSGELAVAERKLVVEADKTLNLLLEEGSSIAFPETVMQMRDDMQQVADRLDAAKLGTITQAIEEDIIAALEEMIEALQKAQQELEDQQQQQQQMQQAQPGEMPLVDMLSELKMVRALQMRVNTRTQRYSELLDNADDLTGQATDAELQSALTKLAERQENIYRITRDLVLGKNR